MFLHENLKCVIEISLGFECRGRKRDRNKVGQMQAGEEKHSHSTRGKRGFGRDKSGLEKDETTVSNFHNSRII